MGTVNLVKVCY